MKAHHGATVCMAILALLASVTIALASENLVDVLNARYPLSRIEVQNAAVQGRVAKPGARLRVQAEGLPAKAFRVTQVITKSPRFHVGDYARIEVASGHTVTLGPGELILPKSTEVVVLDVKVQADVVRMFTHTSEPISASSGRLVYGCTEFVFRFDGMSLKPADAARVQQVIEQWLSPRRAVDDRAVRGSGWHENE